MNILVCFKTEPDWDNLSQQELTAICQGGWDERYAVKRWAPNDEAALVCALRLKEELSVCGRKAHLTAVTAGPCPEKFFTELFALKFDRIVQLLAEVPVDFHQADVARAIARFVQVTGEFDLILTGQQAGPGESGMIPPLLSAILEFPCLEHVSQVSFTADEGLSVTFHDDVCLRRWSIYAPCLCALEHARYPFLPMAKLQERLAAQRRKPDIIPLTEQYLTIEQSPDVLYNTQAQTGICYFWEMGACLEEIKKVLKDLG